VELAELGYFSKTHGIRGQLLLKVYRDFDPELLKAVFIDVKGSKAPYFISAANPTAHGVLLSLEEIDTIEKAKPLLNKQVFADVSSLIEEEEEESLAGYTLTDKKLGLLGEITEITENGAQELMHVMYREREVILPLVDDFIVEIDDKKRTILYDAPEGLIDVYFE
jgi:16S rRNA processing protein RimM